jgi:hypothetical protein
LYQRRTAAREDVYRAVSAALRSASEGVAAGDWERLAGRDPRPLAGKSKPGSSLADLGGVVALAEDPITLA